MMTNLLYYQQEFFSINRFFVKKPIVSNMTVISKPIALNDIFVFSILFYGSENHQLVNHINSSLPLQNDPSGFPKWLLLLLVVGGILFFVYYLIRIL